MSQISQWVAPCQQRSLEDEINRTTAEDIPIFMISYAVIFVYIAVALGEYSSWKRILVRLFDSVHRFDCSVPITDNIPGIQSGSSTKLA